MALLQVSVAVRAREHFGTLVAARSGRLKAEFQSKLGWLIGNLSSRVATEDMPRSQREAMISQFIDSQSEDDQDVPRWVPKSHILLASRAKANIVGLTRSQIAAVLATHRPDSPMESALTRVVESLRELLPEVQEEQIDQVRKRLAADPVFQSACKPAASG